MKAAPASVGCIDPDRLRRTYHTDRRDAARASHGFTPDEEPAWSPAQHGSFVRNLPDNAVNRAQVVTVSLPRRCASANLPLVPVRVPFSEPSRASRASRRRSNLLDIGQF